jgi:curved DNA-binding protein
MANYYQILGVPQGADEKTIRQAYRRLAREHHPDVNPGNASAEERFKAVNEAYSVLSSSESRTKYDRYGDKWKQAETFSNRQANSKSMHFSFDPSNIFNENTRDGTPPNSSFNGPFEPRSAQRPEPKEYRTEITLEEAYSGAIRRLKLSNGKRLEVKIPVGVDSGSKIHMQGIPDQDGSFYLVIELREHTVFTRLNDDLFINVEAYPDQLVLGSELTIQTLTGDIALNVPPLTQNCQRFRLSGQGMPSLKSPDTYGDLFATVKVTLPITANEYELEIYESLRDIRNEDTEK